MSQPFSDPRVRRFALDLVEHAELIEAWMDGVSFEAYANDTRARFALDRALSIVCEAARRMMDAGIDRVGDIPLAPVRSMGNMIRHGYDGLDLEATYDILRDDVPALAAEVRRALTGPG